MTAASSHSPPPLNIARWSILVVPLMAFVAHIPALSGGFVLDDVDLLVENPFVRTLGGLKVLLTSELFMACASPRRLPYWRPLSGALNWVSWQIFAESAPGQHL